MTSDERLELLLYCQLHLGPILPLWGVIETPEGLRCECGDEKCEGRNAGKHPRFRRNTKRTATYNPAKLKEWFEKYPNGNWGVRTGEKVLVIDLDMTDEKDGLASIRELEEKHGASLQNTVTVMTGRDNGSRHLYFEMPEGFTLISKGQFIPGVDMKCINQYVVAPGSRHIAGGDYHFAPGLQYLPVSPAPQFLIDLLNQPSTSSKRANSGPRTAREPSDKKEWIKHLPPAGKLVSDAVVKGIMRKVTVARQLFFEGKQILANRSGNDMRLASELAFYTKHNFEQAMRLFFQSKLYREKFHKFVDEDKLYTYAEWTIRTAFINNPNNWLPAKRKSRARGGRHGRKPSNATCAIIQTHLLYPGWKPKDITDFLNDGVSEEWKITGGSVRKVLHGLRSGRYQESVTQLSTLLTQLPSRFLSKGMLVGAYEISKVPSGPS